MNTIIILAEALAKAAFSNVSRIDVQYNSVTESYKGRVWIEHVVYDISDNGEIIIVEVN